MCNILQIYLVVVLLLQARNVLDKEFADLLVLGTVRRFDVVSFQLFSPLTARNQPQGFTYAS